MKKFLKKLARKNYFFRKIQMKRREKKRIKYYKENYLNFEIDEKLILVESYQGRNFSCSPKGIYEYMINNEDYNDYRFIIPLRKVNDEIREKFENDRTEVVKYRTKTYFNMIAQAKYWISNSVFETTVIKKEDQKYLQTWHGTPLKKIAFDLNNESVTKIRNNKEVAEMYETDLLRYDMMCSPSPYYTNYVSYAFHLKEYDKENIMYELGYPRNDKLMNYTKEDITKVKETLNIPKDKKVIMYAPTWRDDQHQLGVGFTMSIVLDLAKLYQTFKDEYVFIFRLHQLVASSINLEGYENFIFDCSKHDDINDLHIISDVLITDYSSLFFDYANLKKPMLFYMYDLEKYGDKTRGFCFDFKDLPGPILKNEKELFEALKDIEKAYKSFEPKINSFNDKYNPYEDGNSAKRVIEKFLKL